MSNLKKESAKLLNISINATKQEIKSAYKKLARKYHPDLHMNKPEEEQKKYKDKFQELTYAYEVMMGKYDDKWEGGDINIPTFEDLLKSNAYGDYIECVDQYEYEVKGETPVEIVENFVKEIRNAKKKHN